MKTANNIKISALAAAFVFCLVSVMFLFGAPVSAAESVKLSKSSLSLQVGETATLKLTGASGSVKWNTTNKAVCRYSKGGIVTAMGEGKAFILAEYKGVQYQCPVTVTAGDDSGFSTNIDTVHIKKGDTVKLRVLTDFNSVGVTYQSAKLLSVSTKPSGDYSGFTLSIKGKAKGKTTLTIYNAKNKSERVQLKVIVGDYSDDSPVVTVSKASSGKSVWSKDEEPDISTYVDDVIALVNKARKARGLNPLKKSDALCADAALRAEEATVKFSHIRPDGTYCFTAISIPYGYSGENIAMGQRTPDEVMDCWMDSDGHRGNILNVNYQYIGVGYDTASNVWVQIFISDPV